jgi:hypothetical protein
MNAGKLREAPPSHHWRSGVGAPSQPWPSSLPRLIARTRCVVMKKRKTFCSCRAAAMVRDKCGVFRIWSSFGRVFLLPWVTIISRNSTPNRVQRCSRCHGRYRRSSHVRGDMIWSMKSESPVQASEFEARLIAAQHVLKGRDWDRVDTTAKERCPRARQIRLSVARCC